MPAASKVLAASKVTTASKVPTANKVPTASKVPAAIHIYYDLAVRNFFFKHYKIMNNFKTIVYDCIWTILPKD